MMIRAFLRDDRGQAFYETVIFMPLMLLALVSIIFFARLGVLSERAESAVRYGDLVSFRNGEAYSTAAVSYLLNQAVYGNSSTQLAALCLSAPASAAPSPGSSASPAPAATGVNGDILAALYQVQVVHSTASPASTPPPPVVPQRFFQADSITQPNCNPGTINLDGQTGAGASGTYTQTQNGGGSTGTKLPMDVDNFTITAKVNLNSYLKNTIGTTCNQTSGIACASTTANASFINIAAPSTLITCVPGLSIVLTIMNPLAQGQSCS